MSRLILASLWQKGGEAPGDVVTVRNSPYVANSLYVYARISSYIYQFLRFPTFRGRTGKRSSFVNMEEGRKDWAGRDQVALKK